MTPSITSTSIGMGIALGLLIIAFLLFWNTFYKKTSK